MATAFKTCVGGLCCEAEPVEVTTCAELQTAFDVSGGVAGVDLEVEITDLVDGSCGQCESHLETTYLFSSMAYSSAGGDCCQLRQDIGSLSCTSTAVLHIIFCDETPDKATLYFSFYQPFDPSFGIRWGGQTSGVMVPTEADLVLLLELLNTGSVTLDLELQVGTRCDATSATCVVRIA